MATLSSTQFEHHCFVQYMLLPDRIRKILKESINEKSYKATSTQKYGSKSVQFDLQIKIYKMHVWNFAYTQANSQLISQFECDKIPFKNYFIRISEQYLYAYIVTPIRVLKHCRGNDQIINLKESQRISLPTGCTIFKYSKKFHFNGKNSDVIDITPQNINMYANLSLPEINKQLSLLPLWHKYELQLIDTGEKMKRIQKSILLQRKNIDNMKVNNNSLLFNIFSGIGSIGSYLENKFIQLLIFAVILIFLALICKTLLMKFLTKWK